MRNAISPSLNEYFFQQRNAISPRLNVDTTKLRDPRLNVDTNKLSDPV